MAGLTFEITRRALLGGIGTLTLAKVTTTTSTDGFVTNKGTSKGGDPNVPTYPQRKVTSYLLFDDVSNVNIPESLSEFRTVGYHTQGVGVLNEQVLSQQNGYATVLLHAELNEVR